MKIKLLSIQNFFSVQNKGVYKFEIFNKHMQVNKGLFHRLIMLLLCLVLNLGLVKLLYSITIYSFEKWLSLFVILLILCFVYQCVQLLFIKSKLFSLSFLFLCFSYIFHLSFTILMYFKVDMGNILTWFTLSEFKSASTVSLFFILFLTLGYVFSDMIHSPVKVKWKFPDLDSEMAFFGYFLLIISLLASTYINVVKIYTLVNNGYLEAATLDVNIILVFISYLLLPAIFILSLYYRENKKKVNILIFTYIGYLLLSMMTGQRAYALIQIFIILLLYHIYINPFTVKKVLFLSIGAVFILMWLVAIKYYRSTGNFSFLQFNRLTNILIEPLKEFGSTIHVLTRAVAFDDKGVGVGGKQLLCTLLTPIPFVSRIFPNIFNSNIYTVLDLFRLGGSFIADFYYDFGYLGCIGISFFGVLISKLDMFIRLADKKNYYFIIAAILPFIIELIFSVRSTLYIKSRTLVYCIILYMFFYFLSKMLLSVIRKYRR